jgi:hypothetical protein
MQLNTITKQRYRVDLPAEHAECESNYARLIKLLPLLSQVDHSLIGLPAACEARFTVLERSPYTTRIELSITRSTEAGLPAVLSLAQQLCVQLYHDAGMAEVVNFQQQHKPAARYCYPNAAMFQPNEKWQWNHFLGEWLAYCLLHGYSIDHPIVFNKAHHFDKTLSPDNLFNTTLTGVARA